MNRVDPTMRIRGAMMDGFLSNMTRAQAHRTLGVDLRIHDADLGLDGMLDQVRDRMDRAGR